MYGLKRSNYFIIGLFCDRTMSMNVIRYFRNHPVIKSGLREFYFRTKDSGGWPGGVRIVEDNGKIHDLPNTERMKVKDYFQPERCLYCLDKLNVYADISVGDNYTGRNSDIHGSNSVIIRTEEGLRVWRELEGNFEVHESSAAEIETSQHIGARKDNYFFALIKGAEVGIEINGVNMSKSLPSGIVGKYRKKLKTLRLGANPEDVVKELHRRKIIDIIMIFPRKIRGVIRRIKRLLISQREN